MASKTPVIASNTASAAPSKSKVENAVKALAASSTKSTRSASYYIPIALYTVIVHLEAAGRLMMCFEASSSYPTTLKHSTV